MAFVLELSQNIVEFFFFKVIKQSNKSFIFNPLFLISEWHEFTWNLKWKIPLPLVMPLKVIPALAGKEKVFHKTSYQVFSFMRY